jgi:hypothetical protein
MLAAAAAVASVVVAAAFTEVGSVAVAPCTRDVSTVAAIVAACAPHIPSQVSARDVPDIPLLVVPVVRDTRSRAEGTIADMDTVRRRWELQRLMAPMAPTTTATTRTATISATSIDTDTATDLRIETTKRLAAHRQIDAALGHLHKSELEAAIALATAAEGLLPDAEGRGVSAYLQKHELSKQVDIDKTIDWLKRDAPPDAATISEFEAAAVIARAMSKFAAAYTDAPPEWYDFLSWGVTKGHWPTLRSMT